MSAPDDFDATRSTTGCLFATAARIERVCEWDPELTVEENVGGFIPKLEKLCASVEDSLLDGILIEAPGHLGQSVERLAQFVGQVLREIVQHDPSEGRCLDQPIEQPGWWLTFADVELFVLTFAPCYPPTHSRWTGGADSVFLMLQPRSAFERRRHPGSRSLRANTRRIIRRAFRNRGMEYDTQLAQSPIEAYQFVKPLKVGDPPIRWWLTHRAHESASQCVSLGGTRS